MGAFGLFERLLLHVLGDDDRRRAAARNGEADGAVDDVRQLCRMRDLLNELGDVGEHPVEVELLLVARAAHRRLGLAADGEERRVVRFGVVKAGDQMRRARSAGREANPELAREFGVADSHEGTHFLVPRLDEIDASVALDGTDGAVDAVARIAEDPFDSPAFQAFDKEIRGLHVVNNAARTSTLPTIATLAGRR